MTPEAYRFPIRLGGNLALDFTNTVEFRASERQIDFLHTYDHLVAWCDAAGSAASDSQREAEFERALTLRAALYHIFTSHIEQQEPAEADLETLNAALAKILRRIKPENGGFKWIGSQRDLLAPIALAAADLLTSDDLRRVRQCPNCGWLFVDTSRNHSRRWCSMDFCGSQMKSRRQYARRKAANA